MPPAPAANASLPTADSQVVQATVKGLMDAAYGASHYDTARQCWTHAFETPNDTLDYCMKPAAPQVVAGADGAQVYLLAYSDPSADSYSQVDPGLKGLMAASLSADGQWKAIASSPAIDAGQAGDCGCRDARLQQVGPGLYGWLASEGGVWQGVAVIRETLTAPVGETFKQVATIPDTGSDGGKLALQVDAQAAATAGFYPLVVTRTGGKAAVDRKVIPFDAGKGVYPWTP
ncbi:hypothetical protein [Pseudoxanthomonas sp. GM95]|uniref:hypothetical protein n=1 Tax=Pseudoxanthomonas sp. GM95 TaxID=1881043 RepID=UPI000B80CA21|nr:hypothetical protein [Pseudoxanthomonas sp. GM95]